MTEPKHTDANRYIIGVSLVKTPTGRFYRSVTTDDLAAAVSKEPSVRALALVIVMVDLTGLRYRPLEELTSLIRVVYFEGDVVRYGCGGKEIAFESSVTEFTNTDWMTQPTDQRPRMAFLVEEGVN